MRNSMMMAALVLGLAACGKKDDGGAKPAPTAAAPAAGSGTAAAPAAGSGTAAAAPAAGSGTAAAPAAGSGTAAAAPGSATCDAITANFVKAGLADAPPDAPEAELAMARTMFQQMGEVVARQCGEDKWPQPVVECMATSATIEECDALMSPELKQRLEDVLAKQLALTAGPAGDVAGAPAAGGAAAPVAPTGIAECDQLMATFSKLLSCDKLPEMMKGQFDQLRATMAQGLGMIQMVPADQRGAIVDGCKQGLAQLQDAAKQTGCAL